MSSSTSSSERRIPWGAVWGIAIFLVVELVCRLLPARVFLTFDQNDYEHAETLDFTAVSLATELLPPPDVVVLGTSRSREAIQSPVLAEAIAGRLGRSVAVRNYSSAAGRIDVSVALFERLLSERKLPRVIVLPLDASDFRDERPDESRWRYVTPATLPGEIAHNGWPAETDLAHVIGNALPLRLSDARATVRYRLLDRGDWDWPMAMTGNPALGGTTAWARKTDRRMKSRKVPPPMTVVKARLQRNIQSYLVFDRPLSRLRELAQRASAAGVRLVLAELPVAPLLRDEASVVHAQARLEGALAALEAGDCLRIWALSGAQEQFGGRSYLDPAHLNSVGARKFVSLIAPVVADALAAAGRPCAP